MARNMKMELLTFSLILYQWKNCGHRIHVLFMMYDVYWYCQMKKNEWLWFFLKRNDLYENLEKRGGSREKGGGGNKIHAPCACGLLYILQAKISCFVNAGSLSAMFNLKTSSKRQLIFLSFFTWIMVVLNNKYVDMFNL